MVLNNFGEKDASSHVKLMKITLQNMFPSINVATVKLPDCRRVVMFNLDKVSGKVEMRHFAVRATPTGITRAVKKVGVGDSDHSLWKGVWNLWNGDLLCHPLSRPASVSSSPSLQPHPKDRPDHFAHKEQRVSTGYWSGIKEHELIDLLAHRPMETMNQSGFRVRCQ